MSKKHKETVQKQFAKTVDAFSKYAVRDTDDVLAEKVEFVKPQPTDLVLDVACGPGTFALALARRARFARGVDLTEEMLQQARKFQHEQAISNAHFDCGDAEQLPYAGAAFDLVTCQCAIHHMPKPELVLKEMIRVTKPRGRILVIDTLAPESDSKFELHNRIEETRDPSHSLSLRLTTFLSLFEKGGLETVRQRLKPRLRSFNQWMRRAGLEPGDPHYHETRQLMEKSIAKDSAGFAPKPQEDDILITHNEGMFLLNKAGASADVE